MPETFLHLDTNILVDLITADCPYPTVAIIQTWLAAGEKLAVSSIAWSEVCNGNITRDQKEALEHLVEGRVLDFTKNEAETASRLFHRTGRKRGSHADCMIAAAALSRRHPVATRNLSDFDKFVPYGLDLRRVPSV